MKLEFALAGLLALVVPTAHAATSFFDLPVLQPNPQPGKSYIPNDVDGDGTSDLLWFNPVTRQVGYWLIQLDGNGHFHRGATRTIDVAPGYFAGAVGDFNGDGKVDIVWTSDNDDLYLWTSNGTSFRSSVIGTYPAGWRLMGAGDVDGDGYPDLLWFNPTTDQFAYWLMRDGKRVGARTYDVAPGYELVAIGYSGTRRQLSLIWLNQDGEVYGWDATASGFRSFYAGNIAKIYGTYQIDSIKFRADGVAFTAIDTTLGSFEGYFWARQFDAHGNQTSSTLTNGSSGGWLGHTSGEIYYRWQGASAGPVDVMTDRQGLAGYPQTLAMYSIYEPFMGINRSADIYTGFPADWYVLGEPWYRSDLIQYGPKTP